MKITQVSYEKLFNLGEYEHEKIGYTATVEPNETGDQVMVKLIQFTENSHQAINMLKAISIRLARIYASHQDPYCTGRTTDAIEYHEEEVERKKEQIKHISKQRKEVLSKEKKKEFSDMIAQKEEEIIEHEKTTKALKKEGKELTKKQERYRKMFFAGDFSFLIRE